GRAMNRRMDLSALIEASRSVTGPSTEDRERNRAKIAARVGSGIVVGAALFTTRHVTTGLSGGAASGSGATAVASGTLASGLAKWVAVSALVAVAVGGGAGFHYARRHLEAGSTVPPPSAPVAEQASPVARAAETATGAAPADSDNAAVSNGRDARWMVNRRRRPSRCSTGTRSSSLAVRPCSPSTKRPACSPSVRPAAPRPVSGRGTTFSRSSRRLRWPTGCGWLVVAAEAGSAARPWAIRLQGRGLLLVGTASLVGCSYDVVLGSVTSHRLPALQCGTWDSLGVHTTGDYFVGHSATRPNDTLSYFVFDLSREPGKTITAASLTIPGTTDWRITVPEPPPTTLLAFKLGASPMPASLTLVRVTG